MSLQIVFLFCFMVWEYLMHFLFFYFCQLYVANNVFNFFVAFGFTFNNGKADDYDNLL